MIFEICKIITKVVYKSAKWKNTFQNQCSISDPSFFPYELLNHISEATKKRQKIKKTKRVDSIRKGRIFWNADIFLFPSQLWSKDFRFVRIYIWIDFSLMIDSREFYQKCFIVIDFFLFQINYCHAICMYSFFFVCLFRAFWVLFLS